jgi:hypothetical protein
MIISKKRIRSLGSNLKGVQAGQEIVVALPYCDDIHQSVIDCGFDEGLEPGDTILPLAVGPVTKYNSIGKYIVHKDQPMETAYRQSEWTWQEFRGRYDTVEQSKIVDVPYERYPRTYVEPPSVELSLATNNEGNLLIVSSAISNTPQNEELITHTINIFLELFNECHILNTDLQQIIRAPVRKLNWEILPQGKRPWKELRNLISPIIDQLPDGNKKVIDKRIETINEHEPDFVAIGRAGFTGYLVFGFPAKDLYILESTQINNATYVIDNNWELLSSLTKAEILNNDLHRERVIHRENWFDLMNAILNE